MRILQLILLLCVLKLAVVNGQVFRGISVRTPGSRLDYRYHHYDEMVAFLNEINVSYPHLTSLYTIGKSVQGRDLWVMIISANPTGRTILQPEVKYVGNIHGNEPVGRELLLHLIEHLVTNYESDDYVRWLLSNTRIHILVSMNPDGFESSREGDCDSVQGRYNSNGFDLNRDFPDYFTGETKPMQPESEAVSRWLQQYQFVLSAALHGGALVASYPFDNSPKPGNRFIGFQPSLTPDDDTFRHLATSYSFKHATMHIGTPCHEWDPTFPNGTTNGADWYYLAGGMQDYNYVVNGCMELTLEVSCCKYPTADQLPKMWIDNKLALLTYLGEVHRGVKGTVSDTFGNGIPAAFVRIKNRTFGSKTTVFGEYWRILRPGFYTIQVSADGYLPYEEVFQVSERGVTLLNVQLHRADQAAASSQFSNPVSSVAPTRNRQPVQRPSIFSSLFGFIRRVGG